MRLLLRISPLLALTFSLRAAIVLDSTYEQVIAEKGQPTGKMQAGDNLVLRYPDVTIRLKAGRVIGVEAGKGQPAPRAATVAPVATPTPPPAPAAMPDTRATGVKKATWGTDYAAALSEAKGQNRRVFLFFTGSDWCGWCMRLQKEILTTPEFASYASDNLVLVELDFPQKKRLPAPVKSQNEALARKYGIEGFPTVIVLDGSGRKVGQLGYQEGGPAPFVKALKSL